MTASNIKFTVGSREYSWYGGYGSVIENFENGLKLGECRVIGDDIFYVFAVERRRFSKDRVSWGIPHDLKPEDLRALKAKFLG